MSHVIMNICYHSLSLISNIIYFHFSFLICNFIFPLPQSSSFSLRARWFSSVSFSAFLLFSSSATAGFFSSQSQSVPSFPVTCNARYDYSPFRPVLYIASVANEYAIFIALTPAGIARPEDIEMCYVSMSRCVEQVDFARRRGDFTCLCSRYKPALRL